MKNARKERILEKDFILQRRENRQSVDMLITMVVHELTEELRKDPKEVLSDFCVSKTGKALYDESTKLWWNGPSYIADMYKEELNANKLKEDASWSEVVKASC